LVIDERIALKIRLEQLESAEIRILKEFREERENIFKRLRELDEKQLDLTNNSISTSQQKEYISFNPLSSSSAVNDLDQFLQKDKKMRRSRPSRRSKSSKMREAAIHILQDKHEPIRGSELQRLIEKETGFKIANMTSFMKTVEKADSRIKKPERGLYFFQPIDL